MDDVDSEVLVSFPLFTRESVLILNNAKSKNASHHSECDNKIDFIVETDVVLAG